MATLKDLKVKALQDIASSCGLLKSGNKAQVYQRIRTAARQFKPLPPNARILSIDMGIRNMAFCLLRPQGPPFRLATNSKGEITNRGKPSVQVGTWKRLALDVRSSHDTTTESDPEATTTAEDFSPAQMAKMALSFVQSHILPSDPTHILIERQRYRSASSPAITNWTIRVNSLEAMIYSMLAVYKSLGKFHGEVIPVTPRSVATFLLDEHPFTAGLIRQGIKARLQKEKMETSKKNKVDLLGRLIRHKEEPVTFSGEQAGRIAYALADRRSGGKKKKAAMEGDGGVQVEIPLPKVDDLADCLLQGIAWVEWHRNMEHLIVTEPWVTGPAMEVTPTEALEMEDDGGDLEQPEKVKRGKKRGKVEKAEESEAKTRRTRKGSIVGDQLSVLRAALEKETKKTKRRSTGSSSF
ncbi:mitochondrial resolvase Ydc2 [Rhypophila decipiens]|uniref:Mitochondrial resolvase Ydc2 n=1 Tax=Rhypophila decipiens TaxID=261697 RepID=A0AAN6Y5S5_9PEZI|nr:mitochondrial resolvase Ydc2 [Rhypophila decipiens]